MATGPISPAEVLRKYKTIAVVGASRSQQKEAYRVPRYLKENGYQIIPINPAATEIIGEKAYPSLLDLPRETAKNVEIVEVFRPSDELPGVALQVVEMKKRYGRPHVFWAQQGLQNEEARRILDGNQIPYVMDSCMRTVHQTYVKG
ncbi:MAG: CoA-binding protein [Thaumarchaeota archaeon]|nr:CoA-binding protein [Nitrososphaerota archaeon]